MKNSSQLSALPAHKTWVDLQTRIASQELHFRAGNEEAAIDSIVDFFKSTRALMRESIGADEFIELADSILKVIRPYTARWHALIAADKRFICPTDRRQFRVELLELQTKLQPYANLFEGLSKGHSIESPRAGAQRIPNLGPSVPLGISNSPSALQIAQEIDRLEHQHVAARRKSAAQGNLQDGVGLALSGGGIRSATFCLGVVQVLAQQKLLSRFDYLSTVSGGGYLGCFISNQFSEDEQIPQDFEDAFDPRRQESSHIRHLRNSSKYLLPTSTWEFIKLIGQLCSGVVASALLTVAIPVLAAVLFHFISHMFGVGVDVVVSDIIFAIAAFCGLVVAVCWLARPLRFFGQSSKGHLDNISGFFISLALFFLTVGLTPLILDKLHSWSQWKITIFSVSGIGTFVMSALALQAVHSAWKYKKTLSRFFIFSGILLFLIVYLWLVDTLGFKQVGIGLTLSEKFAMGFLLLWAFWALSINLNETGLRRYYRDRLAKCYLGAEANPRNAAKPIPLNKLSNCLPYHLINATVNLTSSKRPELRGRGGDFFLLSKFFCGSPITGYIKTEEVIRANPDLDLATAMAISGAAFSTNMGSRTMHEFRTLMALLNVRLGYWMRVSKEKELLGSNAFVQLIDEIRGKLDGDGKAINLSDGGHIENLAAYELIRRKMRFIVCVDGGMDPDMTFSDLNRLQRLVAIDFGYRIEFDDAKLKLQNSYSRDYGVLVKIDYSPEKDQPEKMLGWMLYIKLAMLGTEANYVMDYRRANPTFPHQSTADQFFDEAQFEAYRKLGETAAYSFFRTPFHAPSLSDIDSGNGFKIWFESLAGHLLLDTDPVFY